MTKPRQHARIIAYPFATALQGARLEVYREEWHGQSLDLILKIRACEKTRPGRLFQRGGRVYEHIRGVYFPLTLRFVGVSELQGNAFFINLAGLPLDSPERTIIDLLSWKPPERERNFHMLSLRAPEADGLQFFSRRVVFERRTGPREAFELERDWSPPPPMPGGLVPRPRQLYRRFGGDPVTVYLNGNVHHRRLFIGGVDVQGLRRPEVDTVLNLGEEPSRWASHPSQNPADRWVEKGEGWEGMDLAEIRAEAGWVLERLQAGQRVLVHCMAGMNRSTTICSAVLILLEGLTAEEALERVRLHHPWARPDSHHWLQLRWLAAVNQASKGN